MDKFGRNYRLTVNTAKDGDVVITLPFTVEFDVTRNTLSSANVCQLRIFNLALINRNKIRKNVTDYGNKSHVKFDAGYGDNLSTIFTGTISQAWSVREGTNFITQIECFDGGFAFVNGKTNRSFPAGTFFRDVIISLIGDLPGISIGAVGSYPGQLQRGASYSGATVDLLRELTGGGFFIDGNKAYALGNSEFIREASTVVVNASTGLLGTPALERDIAHFEMIFEPSLNVGRQVQLESSTESNFNGFYKISQVKHRGMISGAVAGNATTSAQFYFFKLLSGVGQTF